jgi:hypothetical protein
MEDLTKVDSVRQMNEFIDASRIVNYLKMLYPAYRWTVCKDTRGGVLKIAEANLMQTNVPYIIKLKEVEYSEKALQRAVKQAAGEILERYCMSREVRSGRKVEDLMDQLPSDFKGDYLFDAQGVPNWIGERSNA